MNKGQMQEFIRRTTQQFIPLTENIENDLLETDDTPSSDEANEQPSSQ